MESVPPRGSGWVRSLPLGILTLMRVANAVDYVLNGEGMIWQCFMT